MAKKENDENKDVNQDSEEDFGLPDLEFEELDDIDEVEGEDDNLADEIAEITGDSSTEDNSSEDSHDMEGKWNDDTSDSESLSDIGAGDTDSTESFDTESEGDELDEVEKFISEITADDETDEDGGDSSDLVESEIEGIAGEDDNEGLSDVGSGMFGRDKDSSDEHSSSYDEEDDDDGGTSPAFTRIIIFGLVGAVILAFVFLYISDGPDEPVAQIAAPVIEEPVEETPIEEEPVDEAAVEYEPLVATKEDPAVQQNVSLSTGTPGEITTISSSAGRYYIVVASFIDDDMAKDHANDLAAQGASVKIVEPFNARKYYRVSVADYGSRQDAINAIEQLKPQYGDDIWGLKY